MTAAVLALSDYWWQWADLAVRWLHVIAGIAWIGASFYFIALDNHLEPPDDPRDARRGVAGEVWELHGGGFYRVEKFQVAPERLPDPLHWFKWEAYTTWLSGFTLLIMAIAYRFLIERPIPWLSNQSQEDRWTRAGVTIRRRLGFRIVGELDEGEAARPTGFPIGHDLDLLDLAAPLFEKRPELSFAGLIRNVPDVQSLRHSS